MATLGSNVAIGTRVVNGVTVIDDASCVHVAGVTRCCITTVAFALGEVVPSIGRCGGRETDLLDGAGTAATKEPQTAARTRRKKKVRI